jgi:hypothetical protein
MRALRDDPVVQEMVLFARPNLTGFNLVRAFVDSQDVAYHAVRGVSTAAVSVAKEIGQWGHVVILPPVIVVDSPLIQCHLPEHGADVELAEIQRGALLYNTGETRVAVHVVHVSALPDFLKRVGKEASILRDLMKDISSEEHLGPDNKEVERHTDVGE